MSDSNAREVHFDLHFPDAEAKRFWKAANQINAVKVQDVRCFKRNWFSFGETEMAVAQMLFAYYFTALDKGVQIYITALYNSGRTLVTVHRSIGPHSGISGAIADIRVGVPLQHNVPSTPDGLEGFRAAAKATLIHQYQNFGFQIDYTVAPGSSRAQYEYQVISLLRAFWVLPFLLRIRLQATTGNANYPIAPLLAPCEDLIRILSAELNRPKEKLGLTLERVYKFLKDSGYIDKLCAQADEAEAKQSSMLVDLLLRGTETAELEQARDHERALQESIERLTIQLAAASRQLREKRQYIAGLLTAGSRTDEKAEELTQFLNKMSDTFWFDSSSLSPKAEDIRFRVYTFLEDVDIDLLTKLAGKASVYRTSPWSETSAQFFAAVLSSSRYKVRVSGTWLYNSYERIFKPYRNAHQEDSIVDLIQDGYMSNWHVSHYACVSGYLATLGQYEAEGDIIGCLYTALKATKGINVCDSTVSRSWIDALKKMPNDCRCVYDKETQTCITWGEAQEIYKKEGHL